MRWLDGITDLTTWIWTNSGRQWRTEEPGMLQSTGLQSQTCLSNWTTNYLVVTTLFPSPGQGRQLYIFCVRRNHFSLINWLSIHLPSNCFILGFEHTSHFLPLDKRSEEHIAWWNHEGFFEKVGFKDKYKFTRLRMGRRGQREEVF